MTNSYFYTWKDFNPSEILLENYGRQTKTEPESKVSFKKVTLELLASFGIFILFAYSLSLIDDSTARKSQENQIYQFHSEHQLNKNQYLYQQFQQGYIGHSDLNYENSEFQLQESLQRIQDFQNLI